MRRAVVLWATVASSLLLGSGVALAVERTGGPGDDFLEGTERRDTLSGLGGDDTLVARAAYDKLFGGDGDDTLKGGRDGDDVFGGDGNDTIEGGPGKEFGGAGPGDDTVNLGDGNDQSSFIGGCYQGGGGDDTIDGGEGDDSLGGEGCFRTEQDPSPGKDDMKGRRGNDTMLAGPRRDKVEGGPGNDRLYDGSSTYDFDDPFQRDEKGDRATDRLLGGEGDDKLHADRTKTDKGGIPYPVPGAKDFVGCGPGKDKAYVDEDDEVSGCEDVYVLGEQGRYVLQ